MWMVLESDYSDSICPFQRLFIHTGTRWKKSLTQFLTMAGEEGRTQRILFTDLFSKIRKYISKIVQGGC